MAAGYGIEKNGTKDIARRINGRSGRWREERERRMEFFLCACTPGIWLTTMEGAALRYSALVVTARVKPPSAPALRRDSFIFLARF